MSGRDVVVANHAEFNRRSMWGYTAAERAAWDRGGMALQEQALFWGGDGALVLMPCMPDPIQLEETARVRGDRGVEALEVPGDGVFICRDALEHSSLVERIAGHLDGGGRLIPWGATIGFYRLAERLLGEGCSFKMPETAPPEFFARALWLDSKIGARVFLGSNGFPVPRGFLAEGPAEAEEAAVWLARRGSGAVVKANFGAGGHGVRAFPPEDILGSPGFVSREIGTRARYDGCWRSGLLVVEELVGGAAWRESVPLTTDWVVHADGGVELVGSGEMIVGQRTRYEGIHAGRGAVDLGLRARCEELGRRIALSLRAAGYIGWFDADMVAASSGEVFVHEINLRRSCPAYAMDLARLRWGDDWERRGAVSAHDRIIVAKEFSDGYKPVKEAVDAFNRKFSAMGLTAVVGSSSRSLASSPPFVGLAVLGPDSGETRLGLQKMRGVLRGRLPWH